LAFTTGQYSSFFEFSEYLWDCIEANYFSVPAPQNFYFAPLLLLFFVSFMSKELITAGRPLMAQYGKHEYWEERYTRYVNGFA